MWTTNQKTNFLEHHTNPPEDPGPHREEWIRSAEADARSPSLTKSRRMAGPFSAGFLNVDHLFPVPYHMHADARGVKLLQSGQFRYTHHVMPYIVYSEASFVCQAQATDRSDVTRLSSTDVVCRGSTEWKIRVPPAPPRYTVVP